MKKKYLVSLDDAITRTIRVRQILSGKPLSVGTIEWIRKNKDVIKDIIRTHSLISKVEIPKKVMETVNKIIAEESDNFPTVLKIYKIEKISKN